MKYENREKAEQLLKHIDALQTAIEQCKAAQKKYQSDSLDHECSNGGRLYSFYLQENVDGSGVRINLTNCGMGTEIICFVKMKLEQKIEDTKKELESL